MERDSQTALTEAEELVPRFDGHGNSYRYREPRLGWSCTEEILSFR